MHRVSVRRRRSGARRRRARTLVAAIALTLGLAGLVAVRAARAPAAAAPSPTPASTSTPAVELHSVNGTSFVPALEGRRPLFLLVLGSDARPGQPVARSRADSIHIIGINLQTRRATVVGMSYDAWVNVPGFGMQKVSSAMAYGGPQLLVTTIERVTGIPIDFWALTSFWGLARMVDAIGGLSVHVLTPMHDPYAGTNFNPGVHHLDGSQALAFARDRNSFANADLSRTGNQGALLLTALAKLRTIFERDPARILSWIAAFARNVQTNLSVPTLLQLAWTAAQIPPANVNNLVLPESTGTVGAASVVFLSPGASSVFAQLRANGTAAGTFRPEGL